MIRLAPVMLCLLALTGCSGLGGRSDSPALLSFEEGETTYYVKAKFDPFGFNWFMQIWSPQRALVADDRKTVMSLVTENAGATLCNGRALTVEEGTVWNGWAGERVMFMESIGEWRLVGSCA